MINQLINLDPKDSNSNSKTLQISNNATPPNLGTMIAVPPQKESSENLCKELITKPQLHFKELLAEQQYISAKIG